MPLDAPNNCWSANLQSFVDALVASTTFRTLVELPDGPDESVQRLVFGKRLRYSSDGHAWTADELAALRHYAMVFSSPDRPFGFHLQNNACYLPHGTVCVAFGRLVPAAELVAPTPKSTGLTEIHDRQWQNIVIPTAQEMLSWMQDNGGPYPVSNIDVTDDHENKATNSNTQGVWQYSELTFQYSLE